ncbi:hypothetical protein BOO86_27915 [Mycobacterium sp. CBMA 234]|nr:hypothetical protein [Mycolicibacterium sp. CBMA 234]
MFISQALQQFCRCLAMKLAPTNTKHPDSTQDGAHPNTVIVRSPESNDCVPQPRLLDPNTPVARFTSKRNPSIDQLQIYSNNAVAKHFSTTSNALPAKTVAKSAGRTF